MFDRVVMRCYNCTGVDCRPPSVVRTFRAQSNGLRFDEITRVEFRRACASELFSILWAKRGESRITRRRMPTHLQHRGNLGDLSRNEDLRDACLVDAAPSGAIHPLRSTSTVSDPAIQKDASIVHRIQSNQVSALRFIGSIADIHCDLLASCAGLLQHYVLTIHPIRVI